MGRIRHRERQTPYFVLRRVVLLVIVLILIGNGIASAAADDKKEVLYINSYQQGFASPDALTQAIENRFSASDLDIDLQAEYMDSQGYRGKDYGKFLYTQYKYKYTEKKFDVILCSDDEAFEFLLKYGNDLFPDTPIVFSGINYYSPDMLAGHSNITGVVERNDLNRTLAAAFTLQPDASTVIIINDRSATGRANQKNIEDVLPRYQSDATFVFLTNETLPELQHEVSTLPKNSFIILMMTDSGSNGVEDPSQTIIRSLHENTTVPIYGMGERFIGNGMTGGVFTSRYEQGNISAGMVIRILKGTPVASIPVVSEPETRYIFDYQELAWSGLNPDALPNGSILINKPSTDSITLPGYVLWAVAIAASGLIIAFAVAVLALVRIRRTRDALDASEKRYRAVVEDQTELVCRFLPDGTHVFVNDAYCRFFGKERSALLGSGFTPRYSPEEKKQIREHLLSLTPGSPIACMTNRIESGQGEERFVLWNNRAIFDNTGKILEYQSVGRDVTEIRRAEEKVIHYNENLESIIDKRTQELVNSNAKLQQEVAERTFAENMLAAEKDQLTVTLTSIGDGVITTDTWGHVVLINPVAEQITGWSQNDAFCQPLTHILSICDTVDRHPLESPAERINKDPGRSNVLHQEILKRKDGTERVIEECASVISDRNNNIAGFVVVFRDITSRRKVEDERIRSQKMESLGLLAGGIAHDFNNILTALFGNIILARMDSDRSSVAYQRLNEAEWSMMRAKELTRQLLTFSKGGAPVKETADISGLIVDSTQFVLSGSQSKAEFFISKNLWQAEVDTGQIGQVINNIVINADHAMPEGGVIRVSAENTVIKERSGLPIAGGRYVKITIADEGTGITKENLARIFDPYFTTKKQGSGLGLSSALSIIRKHNGYIDVESRPGQGASFFIYLPALEKHVDHAPIPEESPTSGTGHVLVMDDEEAIRDVSGHLLRHLGYRVSLAASGEDAIKIYTQAQKSGDPVDMVIMDLTIPGGMGGKDTIAKLREIDPMVRAIVSSGYSNDPIMAHYRDYGFVGVLTKPYSAKEMAKAVSRAFRKDTGIPDI